MSSDDVCVEEDHEDTEYNFMAEANQKEEKEEYRNDRAVRITRKILSNSPKIIKTFHQAVRARAWAKETQVIYLPWESKFP